MVVVEGILIAIEIPQRARGLAFILDAIHGSILLMSKDQPITRLALPLSLPTMATGWGLFITFQLPLATGFAILSTEVSFGSNLE